MMTDPVLMQERLDDFEKKLDEHIADEDKRWDALLKAQELNTANIAKLTENTAYVVAAWEAATGTVKTLSLVGRFIKWVGGFAFIGVMFAGLNDWMSNH